jgi:TRAP transporter TAXI family solute receptor
VLLIAATSATAGCDGRPAPPTDRLVIATGAAGEVYQAVGTALAGAARTRWSADVQTLTTTGSVENLQLVADGRADVGFATVDTAALARDGEAPFHNALSVVALAGLYDDYVHVVVRADSTIRTLADVRGHRIATGPTASATEIIADRMLNAIGIDPGTGIIRSRLSTVDAADALRSGKIDAFVVTGGLPTPVVADLARQVPVRLLSVGDQTTALQDGFGEQYVARSIPAGTYGLPAEVTTIGVRNVLVVRQDLPDRTAYRLTELLFAAKQELAAAHDEARRLDPRSALATFPVPLHPGASRYYRASKPMAAAPRQPADKDHRAGRDRGGTVTSPHRVGDPPIVSCPAQGRAGDTVPILF